MTSVHCEPEASFPNAEELQGVLRDYMEVTRRLQRTHETLQQEVVRLRREVQSKDRELERRRRLASLGELAAGVAHEVRNPLGAIQLYSGLLRRQIADPRAALEIVDKIDAGIRAIDCVVQDTLALTPRGGAIERRSLREILDGACESCRATIEKCGVILRCEYANPEVAVAADGKALPRVFINLIVNAAQASPRGGTVYVRSDAEREGQVEIRVQDEGAGLPDEVLDRIFEPFFTTKQHGTGLGLTIAHRLLEAHGGSLEARNRPEGGAEFIVTLPTQVGATECERQSEDAGRISAA